MYDEASYSTYQAPAGYMPPAPTYPVGSEGFLNEFDASNPHQMYREHQPAPYAPMAPALTQQPVPPGEDFTTSSWDTPIASRPPLTVESEEEKRKREGLNNFH
jgi:hypothetical protein